MFLDVSHYLLWKRGYCLNPRLHMLFRAATRLLEPSFDINHIFGSLGDWFYLSGVRQRPRILTIVTDHANVDKSLLNSVDRFVVEYPGATAELEKLGIEKQRIRQIFPPVDLARFSPGKAADGPFTVLFASSPDAAEYLDARGVPQILDAATLRPKMRFRLLWRPWGDSAERVRLWINERGLSNVELTVRYFDDMANEYNRAHVTVAPFTDMSRSKTAPNSLVESLACGRPALTTPAVGLSGLICDGRAGIASIPTGEALAENLDRLMGDWNSYSGRARQLAEKWFGAEKFVKAYQEIYSELLSRPASRYHD